MNGVSVEREPRGVVITAHGELDAFTAHALTDAFTDAGDGTVERIVIDLSRVSFLDSTALGVVVKQIKQVLDGGGGARLVLPETSARRIFEITTLDRVLPVAESRAAALLDL